MTELYERAIKDELAYWPGVDVEFGRRSKHRQAVFHFAGSTRFIVMPDSPSDSQRGHLNCVRDVRKELTILGAARLEKRPRQRKRDNRAIGRNMPRKPGWIDRVQPAPLRANPMDKLTTMQFPELLLDERYRMTHAQCPACGSQTHKVIFVGLPGRMCFDDGCNCLTGLAAYAPAIGGENGFCFMVYEGSYLKALWRWLFGREAHD